MTVSKNLSDLLRWLVFISYSIFLYVVFTLPPQKIPSVVLGANDKILHALDFFLLALLAFRTFFYASHPLFCIHAGGKAVGFSLFYGAFLEWAQRGAPGREASFADWVADAVGILIASLIFRISRLTRPS